MSSETRLDAETILDTETVAELRPVCDHSLIAKSRRAGFGQCSTPATFIVRAQLSMCRHEFDLFRCHLHVSGLFDASPRSHCAHCDVWDQTTTVLSVQPLSGNR